MDGRYDGSANLKPLKAGEERTREISSKGGKARAANIRKRKELSQVTHEVLNSNLDPQSKSYRSVKGLASDLDEDDITVGAAMIVGQVQAATHGNTSSARLLLELDSQQYGKDEAGAGYRMSPLDMTKDFIEPYRAVWETFEGDGEYREVIMRGGRGGGKSSFAAELAYEVMMRDPNANVVYLRRYGSDLRNTVFQQFCKCIARHGDGDRWNITHGSLGCRRKDVGTQCYFFGADNPLQAKSFTPAKGYVKLLIFEECDELQGFSYVQEAQFTYLRANGGEHVKQMSLMVYNPQPSKRNWMNEYCREVADDPQVLVCEASYLNVPREWLGDRFFQQADWLKEHRPEVYRNKLLGEVTGTGGELFTNVVEEKISDEQVGAWEMAGMVHQGVDWGYEHPNVFIRVAYDPETDTVYPVFEKYQRHANATKFQEGIRRFRMNETICDSAEPDKIADWLDLGWNAVAAVKRWRGGGRSYAWEWLRSVDRIVVDPARTPRLLNEFVTLEFESLADGTYTSAYPKDGEDGVMATIYALNRTITSGKSMVPGEEE